MDFFPLGLAQGKAFCDREEERHHLAQNILNVKPTLISSSRRYGKTSLALQVIESTRLPYAHIDFFSDISQRDIENNILKGIGTIISKILPAPQRALKIAQEFLAELQVKLTIHGVEVGIEFKREAQAASEMKLLFQKLDQLALKQNQKIILFIDEFQQLAQIENSQALEAIFRHIAQQSKQIMFIFSGSHRHLLQQMFDDRNRPFYKLCDRIVLGRIQKEHYHPYIQKAAQQRWQKSLSTESIDRILHLTEQHPYYVNLLCSRLWLGNTLSTETWINQTWQKLGGEERSQMAAELDLLSNNQRKVLISLARSAKILAPMSKEFSAHTQLSTSSIAQAIKVLEEKDYIYRTKESAYRLIDPLMNKILQGW